MQIKNVVVKPCDNTIHPAISFEVEIVHTKYREGLVSVDGWLESDDGKILANVFEVIPKEKLSEIGASDSIFDSKFKETVYNSTLIASLDEKAVVYIEKRRLVNEKRDVFLTLSLNIKSIVSKANISHLHSVKFGKVAIPQKIVTSSGFC